VGSDYLHAQSAASTLRHFWSLAVEEQFYVVWPALFLVLGLITRAAKNKIIPVAVIVAGSYVLSILYTAQNATDAYFSPFTRACELGAGALLALLATHTARLPRGAGVVLSLGGMAGILALSFTFTDNTPFPGAMVALPVLATCAVLAGGAEIGETRLNAVYDFRPVQLIGLWSYSLYLWHWPVLTIAEQRLGHVPSVWARVLLVLGATVLAAGTYYLMENPIRNAALLRRRAIVSVAMGLLLTVAVIAVSAYEVGSHPAIPAHSSF
jgi:peptidoglycan/LPS O-acetylase OafA/YrhL